MPKYDQQSTVEDSSEDKVYRRECDNILKLVYEYRDNNFKSNKNLKMA